MPQEENSEARLALDRLRQMRVQIWKDHRLSSLLVRPFVLYRLRQTERMMESALAPAGSASTYTYTVQFSREGGQTQRVVSTEPELPTHIQQGLAEEAAYHDSVSGYEALKTLTTQSQAALHSGDIEAASHLASELLSRNTNRTLWYYGNVVHEANQLLGLAALQRNEPQAAGEYLLAAGRTPSSPQLNSFGPTMTLAQALLRWGEREVVSAYLDDVARFWAARPKSGRSPVNFLLGKILASRNAKSIKNWKEAIRRGEIPNLNGIV